MTELAARMAELWTPETAGALLALVAATGLASWLNDAAAAAAGRVPVVGGIAARVVRWFGGRAWSWLEREVKASAERSVKEQETEPKSDEKKKEDATLELQRVEPGLTKTEAGAEIEKALQRLKADAARYEKERAKRQPKPH